MEGIFRKKTTTKTIKTKNKTNRSYRPTLGKMSRQMFLRNTLYNTFSFMLFQAEQSLASTNQWGNVVDGVPLAPLL